MTAQTTHNGDSLGGPEPADPSTSSGTAQKQCKKCGQLKPATPEHFYPHSRYTDGLRPDCRVCHKAKISAWQKANPAKLKAYKQTYRAAHRDEILEAKRDYRERNRERLNEQARLEQRWKKRRAKERAARPPKPVKVVEPKPVKEPKPPIILTGEYGKQVAAFLSAKGLRAKVTIQRLKHTLYQFGQFIGCQWPVTEDEINAYTAECKSRGLSDTSICNNFRALREFFIWLHKRGRIETNPITLAEKPARPHLLPRVPKEEDVKKLLDYLATQAAAGDWQAIRNQVLITLALDSGMRRGELARLQVDDLNLIYKTATVRGGKTKSDRICALTVHTCELLSHWLTVRQQVIGDRETDQLFLSQRRDFALTPGGLHRILEQTLKSAGANHFGLHALRHAFAVYSLRAGASLIDIQKQLGHQNVSMTAVYLRVDDSGRIERHERTNPLSYLDGANGSKGLSPPPPDS